MKRIASVVLFVALAACSKKAANTSSGSGSGTGSAVVATETGSAGSGSAGAGSAGSGSAGSDSAGSGSAMAAGSDTGSGSAAAGSGSGSAVAAGSDSGSGSGSAAGADSEDKTEFDKMTHDQKADFMKKNVVPPMKAAFQKFDAKKYANFGCKTCHGKDPKATKWKMPNPKLPKLDFAALDAGKQEPKAAEFMSKVVKPQMAKILGENELDKAHPDGFGCLECHEKKK